MKILLIFFYLSLLLVFPGCDRSSPPSAQTKSSAPSVVINAPAKTVRLFQDKVQPLIYELPSEALVSWRQFKSQRPALVLLADQPYLNPVPDALKEPALDLLLTGTEIDLRRRGDYDQPDPLILAPQAVRIALQADIFSEVIWLLPDDRPLDQFSWNIMSQQLRQAGLLAEGEELEIDTRSGIARLSVESKTLTLVHADAWSQLALKTPAIVHLDLSYFKSAYRSEGRIPVYQLIKTLCTMLRGMQLETLAVTLSYSTLDGYVDLDGRFTLSAVDRLVREPDLLETGFPPSWKLRARALNHLTMFREAEATSLYQELLELTPDDPAALYDMASRLFYAKQFNAGLELLDRAVERDAGYAVKYLGLAEQARQAEDLQNTELLLRKYLVALPGNPGIKLRLAELLRRQARVVEMQALLAELAQLPWSPIYHADIPLLIETMQKQ